MRKPFSNDKEWIELNGKTLWETDDAVRIDFGDSIEWIPKSHLEDWPDKGKDGEVVLSEWIATEKGLI